MPSSLVVVAVVTQLGILGSQWITHELKQAKTDEVAAKTELVAVKAEEVKQTLKANSKIETDKLNEIHVLVNSRMTQALKKIKSLEERLGIETTEEEPPKQ